METYAHCERLMAQLDGARFVKYDPDGYVYAWFGGHGVHMYDVNGEEVDYWSTGDFAQNDADISDVQESMARRMLGEDEQ